jgi:DNA-binding transcriptional regulator YbjK
MLDRTDLEAKLKTAAYDLCAAGGLGAITFRGLARAADVTVGLLGHRFGSRDALIERLIEMEVVTCEQQQAPWRGRLTAAADEAVSFLAVGVTEYLDDLLRNNRSSALFQTEVLIGATGSAAAERLAEVQQMFWQDLLAGQHADADLLAPMLAGFVADERAFSLALGDLPGYRLLRALGAENLLGGFRGDDPVMLQTLLSEMQALAITASPPSTAADRAAGIAEATADLIEAGGAAAVSHRSVASAAGVPKSTVAHYFRTTEEIVEAGMGALYGRIRRPSEGDVVSTIFYRTGRSTHGMALAAARDLRFRPYAIDMRWRRGENLRARLSRLTGEPEGDRDTLRAQVLSIAMIGRSLLVGKAGATDGEIAEEGLKAIQQLRRRCSTGVTD